jgi:hypothetical protein
VRLERPVPKLPLDQPGRPRLDPRRPVRYVRRAHPARLSVSGEARACSLAQAIGLGLLVCARSVTGMPWVGLIPFVLVAIFLAWLGSATAALENDPHAFAWRPPGSAPLDADEEAP